MIACPGAAARLALGPPALTLGGRRPLPIHERSARSGRGDVGAAAAPARKQTSACKHANSPN
jgi:hypothetical protein